MRKAWLLVGVIAVWWWMRDAPAPQHRVQAAVVPGGFAMLVGDQVIELDANAKVQRKRTLRQGGDVRLVGTRGGAAIGWRDGKHVKLAVLDADGAPKDVSTWGTNAIALCDGAATNEYRFGVGWLEGDGRVWFVHGPAQREIASASAVKPSWCALASAEENIALLWRDGQRLMLNFCTRKECTNLVIKLPIDAKETLLGYGCVRDACLFATRDKHGTTKLYRVDERGRVLVKPLDVATRDTAVEVVGAGRRAFAISYVAKDGQVTIQRVTIDAGLGEVWHFNDTDRAPSLAWRAGKLLVAEHGGKAYVLDVQ
jgi:hypothetical protein